jgi:high-affinity nickel-transport protein
MTLLDTTDGALIMTLYTTTPLSRDSLAILYYSIVLTALTIAIAIAIGVIQLLTLILHVKEPTGRFWDGVGVVTDHYDVIGELVYCYVITGCSWVSFLGRGLLMWVGGAICGSFVLFGGLSVLLYRPWRRRVDQIRERNIQRARLESGDDGDEEVLEEGSRPARTSSEDITSLERGRK